MNQEVPDFLKKQKNAPGEYERNGTTIPPKPQTRPRPNVPPVIRPTRPRPDVPPAPRPRPDVPPVAGKYNFGSFPESIQLREYALKTSQIDMILRQLASIEVTKGMTAPNVNDFMNHPNGYNGGNQQNYSNGYQGQQNQSHPEPNDPIASANKPRNPNLKKPIDRIQLLKNDFDVEMQKGTFNKIDGYELKKIKGFFDKMKANGSISLKYFLDRVDLPFTTIQVLVNAIAK